MKFYMREPHKAIEGMAGLTLEQVGAYNIIIDHLYARDGILPDNDVLLARLLNIHAQRWRRLKKQLMAAGKIRITLDNLIDANGVETCRKLASLRSVSARKAASLRWENHRKANQINETAMRPAMRARNANNNNNSNSLLNLEAEDSKTAQVDDEEFGAVKPHAAIATGELEAIVRAKGWK